MISLAGGPLIIKEMEPLQSTERVKNRILDLQEMANNTMQAILKMKMYRKENPQFEKEFLAAVLSFAFEVKPKLLTLMSYKKMHPKAKESILQQVTWITYYINNFREFDLENAIILLDVLNESCDTLGISSIIRQTGKTFTADSGNLNMA